jgi:acyl carrier protein
MESGFKADEIMQWLVTRISDILEISAEEIDVEAPIMNLALSSVEAIGLSGELEEYLGVGLSPTLVYQHPSLSSLAHHLAGL